MMHDTILYLHGFRSSPSSFKARLLGERLRQREQSADYLCPQLPASPKAAIEYALQMVAEVDPKRLTLIGSSLGGYYATWLAEAIGCRAVLLNPAVSAPQNLEKYVGVTTQFHSNQPFEFKAAYVDELRALSIACISQPSRYFLLAATGDEVLDWREMVAHYPAARHKVIDGSDHGMSDFADHIEEVIAFCSDPW